MDTFTLIASAALAFTFLVAGVMKVKEPKSAALALTDFGLIERPTKPLGYLAGAIELALAALLLIEPLRIAGAVAAAVLLWSFAALVVRAVRAGKRFPCFCFGDESGTVSWWTAARTVALAILAIALAAALLLDSPSDVSPQRQLEALISGVALVATALLTARLPSLRRFNYQFMHPGGESRE